MLLANEEILLVASQARAIPGGLITSPNKIYITNMRILYKDPKFFGLKAKIIDIAFREISNIQLNRGIFSTEIHHLFSRFHSVAPIPLPAVDKQTAQQFNMLIQKGIRRELPRRLEVDEKNAPVRALDPSDPLIELEKLGGLKQKGVITEEEFKTLKAELLKRFQN
jgi:hypothetical protein